MSGQMFAEDIRLVIWDLDETFWDGTLEEGDVTIPEGYRGIPEQLAQRGIISSICSKNGFEPVKARLEQEDLWKWFVFPQINYKFKSLMIQQIVEKMGLRPETILLIDDNPFNRGEVAEQVPGINVAPETIIPTLLAHSQLQGKHDPELNRLERYRVLQMKQQSISKAEKPSDFLRDCEIQVSIHYDVPEQFDRIHDLVNRTNQLNFTKKRWNEDINIARQDYEKAREKNYNVHGGYVKVRDKFGYYGICGYFETRVVPPIAEQLLFSCRVLNMGVEQFIYQLLKFPGIKVADPVVAKLQRQRTVDWIRVVPDAEEADGAPGLAAESAPRLCLHGPCELVQSAHYLRPYFNIKEEFQYPRAGWAIQRPLARFMALADEMKELGIKNMAELGVAEDFPGFDMAALQSDVVSETVDTTIFSFSLETLISVYRHKQTGLLIPFSIGRFDRQDLTALELSSLRNVNALVKEDDLTKIGELFEFHSRFNHDLLASDLEHLAAKLEARRQNVIVVEGFDNAELIDRLIYRELGKLNKIVRKAFAHLPRVSYIRVADYVTSREQEVEINHFLRPVYASIAQRIQELVRIPHPEFA